jgi:exosome complex protein LRP1
MADMEAPSAAVGQISSALDTLDDVLGPLLAAPFNETLARLDNLQKAKLQVLLGYVIHDLMWSKLKPHSISRCCENAL